jgi:hypothetical protein
MLEVHSSELPACVVELQFTQTQDPSLLASFCHGHIPRKANIPGSLAKISHLPTRKEESTHAKE